MNSMKKDQKSRLTLTDFATNRTAALTTLLRFDDQAILQSEDRVPILLEFVEPPVCAYRHSHPGSDAAQYEEKLRQQQVQFLEELRSKGFDVREERSKLIEAGPNGHRTLTVTHAFVTLFNGMGISLAGKAVGDLARMDGVRTITLNQERIYLNLDRSVPYTGAPLVWEQVPGLRGEGVTIAVIDTGIDWTHPMFGNMRDVPNEKVVYAASYTGEPPLDNFGHGTHIAGIAAGEGGQVEISDQLRTLNGMAPGSRLITYKVLTANGAGSAANIILAVEDAYRRGAQVINLSLGDLSGDPYSPESVVCNNAMLGNVVVCTAAGNAGPLPGSIGSPGAAQAVITVGASTDDGVLGQLLRLESDPTREIEMRLLEGSHPLLTPAEASLYVGCALGRLGDFPALVNGQIALIERGLISFQEKASNAEVAGAAACIFYNNTEGNFSASFGQAAPVPGIPAVSISQADGLILLDEVEASGLSRVRVILDPKMIPMPERLAEFSSRGPGRFGWIKPELTAPGVDILSATIPSAPIPDVGMPDASGYLSASGTSMSTPHVAGAAALIRQGHPDWSALQIKAALVNTARFMPGQGGFTDQGAGRINLLAALNCQAVLVTQTNPIAPTHAFGRVVNEGKQVIVSQPLLIQSLNGQSPMVDLTIEPMGSFPAGLAVELTVMRATGLNATSFDLRITADGSRVPDGGYAGWVVAKADWGTLRLPFAYEASSGNSSGIHPPDQTKGRPIAVLPRTPHTI